MKDDNKPLAWSIDLDGSLAVYNFEHFSDEIGKPIEESVKRVQDALARGEQVWIFTARITPFDDSFEEGVKATQAFVRIAQWIEQHIGQPLPVTNMKMRKWKMMLDDRGVELIPNLGITLRDLIEATYVSDTPKDSAGQDSSQAADADVRSTYRA